MRLLAAVLCALLGCVSSQAKTASGAGNAQSIDLMLARADGSVLTLHDLRGKPLVVFLFATYDTSSQLALTQLERVLPQKPGVRALGIALQPDAKEFIGPYHDALSVSFELSYDPTGTVLKSDSELGRVEAVPSFVILDASGVVRARYIGVASPSELRKLVEQAE